MHPITFVSLAIFRFLRLFSWMEMQKKSLDSTNLSILHRLFSSSNTMLKVKIPVRYLKEATNSLRWVQICKLPVVIDK